MNPESSSMKLESGTRLGPYCIQSPLGHGGMGEVYRALDTRLERTVAIKVLRSHVTNDPARHQRFEREARAVATLSHPHICALFDVGSHDGLEFLVMEYLEGETLERRLVLGPLPVDQMLQHSIDIADALDHAHRHRIVHRDLKPANVMLTEAGAKLLDFGLVKRQPEDAWLGAAPDTRDTESLTAEETIVGTPHYMAPEQLEGRDADARADIFAFGAVVYEMATGRRAFSGGSRASLIAAILTTDPPPMATFEPDIPSPLERIVKKCLAKDPDSRWQTARDLRDELRWLAESRPQADPAIPTTRTRRWRTIAARGAQPRTLAIAAASLSLGACVAGFAAWTVMRSTPAPIQPVRFTVAPDADLTLATPSPDRDIAISPDGTRLVSAIRGRNSPVELHVRPLDRLESVPVAGTDGARWPFISADSHWIGFHIRSGAVIGELKKVPMTGGPPITVCEIQGNLLGASWGADDTIVFATNVRATGLLSVPAIGGTPQVLTRPDARQGELDHANPFILPSGRAVLFTIVAHGDVPENSRIAVLDRETGHHKILIRGGSHPAYVDPSFRPGQGLQLAGARSGESLRLGGSGHAGYLIYAAGGALRAVRFDPVHLDVLSDPVPVVEHVLTKPNGTAEFDVSRSGALVYVAGDLMSRTELTRTLVWVDRQGREQAITAPPREYVYPRVSPDGTKFALDVRSKEFHIWIWDTLRESLTRLTVDPEPDGFPLWSRDGKRVIFHSLRLGRQDLFVQRADGTGGLHRLTEAVNPLAPYSMTPDEKQLVAMELTLTGGDLSLVRLEGAVSAEPLIHTSFEEANAEISPDGRWLAYESNELGRSEIYVRPFPDVTAGRWQVSIGGGQHPVWSRDGRELFYISPSARALMSSSVPGGSGFTAGNSLKVFDTPRYFTDAAGRSYDVSPDGRRFLMIKNAALRESADQPRPALTVVLNWFEELKARMGARE